MGGRLFKKLNIFINIIKINKYENGKKWYLLY